MHVTCEKWSSLVLGQHRPAFTLLIKHRSGPDPITRSETQGLISIYTTIEDRTGPDPHKVQNTGFDQHLHYSLNIAQGLILSQGPKHRVWSTFTLLIKHHSGTDPHKVRNTGFDQRLHYSLNIAQGLILPSSILSQGPKHRVWSAFALLIEHRTGPDPITRSETQGLISICTILIEHRTGPDPITRSETQGLIHIYIWQCARSPI